MAQKKNIHPNEILHGDGKPDHQIWKYIALSEPMVQVLSQSVQERLSGIQVKTGIEAFAEDGRFGCMMVPTAVADDVAALWHIAKPGLNDANGIDEVLWREMQGDVLFPAKVFKGDPTFLHSCETAQQTIDSNPNEVESDGHSAAERSEGYETPDPSDVSSSGERFINDSSKIERPFYASESEDLSSSDDEDSDAMDDDMSSISSTEVRKLRRDLPPAWRAELRRPLPPLSRSEAFKLYKKGWACGYRIWD